MSSDSFIQRMPDLVVVMRRDGTIVSWNGGEAVPPLRELIAAGESWSEPTAKLIGRMARQCIARRAPVDVQLREAGCDCDARFTPQGPDKVVCTIRAALAKDTDNTADETSLMRRPGLERREFTRQLRDRISRAALRERPLAVAVLDVDGLEAISQSIGGRTADRVMGAAVQRVVALEGGAAELIGQLGEYTLAVVFETNDRQHIAARLETICAAIRAPHVVEDIQFKLSCFSGVAVLGLEGATPTQLLDFASSAALEARRIGAPEARFHSETVRVRALERFDLARELRDAVERRQIGFRFVPRHELASGRLTTRVAYLHWPHPLRGEIRPAEFLAIAESTGFGASLSRAALQMLCADFAKHAHDLPPHVRISFGPLRDHVMDERFVEDLTQLLDEHGVPSERFELRLSERAFVSRDLSELRALQRRDIRLLVDEVGRESSSLAALARAPLWGLQLDRHWAVAPRDDDVAHSVCRTVAALATALGVVPIAPGVDDDERRKHLMQLGFAQGSGDLFTERT